MEGKSVSCYVKLSQREQVLAEFEERGKLSEEKKRLLAYVDGLQNILKRNPYLNAGVGCGYQDFKDFACGRQFYVDKTHFIAEWVYRDAKVTLITRPRRFGKTTLFSTVETFFDPRFADHPEYFEKLRVWGDKEIRKLFGMVPVICNGVQREHNKKLNNGLPILHKVPPKRDYGRYFCIMAEKGGT